MKVTLSPECISSLEEITGKKITRNGNEVIQEVADMAEANQKPDALCYVESNCSEQEQSEEEKPQ